MELKLTESKMALYMSARPAGCVEWSNAMENKLYLLVNCPNWKGWVNVSRIMSKFINRRISASACRSKWYRMKEKQHNDQHEARGE